MAEMTQTSERTPNRSEVVLTLRYLSTKLILYRPVLTEYLHHVACGIRPDQPASIDAICHTYIGECVGVANEVIDLITDPGFSAMLPSWWFVLHYRESSKPTAE